MLDFRREIRPNKRSHPVSCIGKVRYATKGKAIERIQHQKKTHRRCKRYGGWSGKMVLAPFRCRYCHGWHVGSTSAEDFRRRED